MTKRMGGVVYTFGVGEFGTLGVGQKKRIGKELLWDSTAVPVQVLTLNESSVVKVACGLRHTLALTDDGNVYSWGSGFWGQLGHNDTEDAYAPKMIMALRGRDVVDIACNSFHSAAVLANGRLYTWGDGRFGKLGHGNTNNVCVPTLVQALAREKVVRVACGTNFTVAVTAAGGIYTFGDNTYGALGLGDSFEVIGKLFVQLPQKIMGFRDVVFTQVACGNFHTIALTKNGEVYSWGAGKYGQLGHSDPVDVNTPHRINCLNGRKIEDVSCGNFFSAAVGADGRLYTWGYDGEHHRLGLGGDNDVIVRMPEQVKVLAKKRVKSVSCGANHIAALTSTGDLYIWGCGTEGQLGHGPELRSLPGPKKLRIPLPGGRTASFIGMSCGWSHTAVITAVEAQEEIKKLKESRTQAEAMNSLLKEEIEALKKKMEMMEQQQNRVTPSPPPQLTPAQVPAVVAGAPVGRERIAAPSAVKPLANLSAIDLSSSVSFNHSNHSNKPFLYTGGGGGPNNNNNSSSSNSYYHSAFSSSLFSSIGNGAASIGPAGFNVAGRPISRLATTTGSGSGGGGGSGGGLGGNPSSSSSSSTIAARGGILDLIGNQGMSSSSSSINKSWTSDISSLARF